MNEQDFKFYEAFGYWPNYTINYTLTSPTSQFYLIDESDIYWNVEILAPGLSLEDINIKVENSMLIVDLSEGPFTSKNICRWDFDFKLKPKMFHTELKDGILAISIEKPKDSYFKVEIN